MRIGFIGLGNTGSAMAANLVKLSGNFLITSVIESLGEAMALVGKAGVDKHQYLASSPRRCSAPPSTRHTASWNKF